MSYELLWWEKRRRPWATYLLIALNTIVYLVTSSQNFFYSTSNEWIDVLAYVPVLLQYPEQWYIILSIMFKHVYIFHILF
ncbi:MAG: rhomboid family intramembrane serine protease, partial [Ignisphaera sp.]|nr:rhomboid family intramembrane serine protease [Ignisphaera sp.]